ncbi:hypothetical protein HanRHA438_Chr03g0103331 [Helianthus annuus]|nr:hypothetical protein HanRHA438_Chr03g0103331 [Helianthus annuus]
MVGEKIPSNLCPWMVQMCSILGCIYRKRQHAGHSPCPLDTAPCVGKVLAHFVGILT